MSNIKLKKKEPLDTGKARIALGRVEQTREHFLKVNVEGEEARNQPDWNPLHWSKGKENDLRAGIREKDG